MKWKMRSWFIILFLVLTTTITAIGNSSWYIKNQLNNAGKTIEVGNNTDYCTVYMKNITTKTVTNIETVNENRRNDSSLYDKYYAILGATTGSTNISGGKEGNTITKTIDGGTTTETNENGDIVTSNTITEYSFTGLASYSGLSKYYFTKGTITTFVTSKIISQVVTNKYSVRKNTCLTKPTLSRTDGTYTFVNFLQADATGINTTNQEFDFSSPIAADTIIFAEWIEYKASEGEAESQLTNYVNAATSNGNIFNGSAANFNIINDNSYSQYTKTINLGTKTQTTTIAAGATINFCMNSGDTDIEARKEDKITDSTKHIATNVSPADNYVSLDYTTSDNKVSDIDNVRDYTVILQNDLIINGNMYLGGYTGSQSTGFQGYIIQEYVKLDLNGHNMIINNGGMLHSFGYITDSVGTGKISVMAGGTIKTQLVVDDLKGGNHTVWAYSKGISPFENYQAPYLNCKVEFEVTTSSSGSLEFYTKFNLGSLGFANIYIPFFGSTADSFFRLTPRNSGVNGLVSMETYELSALKSQNNEIKYNCIYLKNKFVFENTYVQVNSISASCNVYVKASIITVDKTMSIELDRVAFPISSSFDLNFINSTFSFFQEFKFMPGSNLYMDENSTLNLDYYKENGTAAQREFESLTVATKTLPGEKSYLSAGLSSLDQPPLGTSSANMQNIPFSYNGMFSGTYVNYWSYFQSATINIYGTVNFASGNVANYVLAGNININKLSVNNGTAIKADLDNLISLASTVNLQTYGFDLECASSIWFESSDILNTSNENAIMRANYFYARPLVSNQTAYAVKTGTSENLSGTFDFTNKIFASTNGQTYFFDVGTSLLDSSDTYHSEAQDKRIDYSISLKSCTVDDTNHWIVAASGNIYILYAGIMVPLTVSGTTYTANTSKLSSIESYTTSNVERYKFASTPFTYHATYKVWRVTY